MTSVLGAASACSRAARFGVSPTTPRSCAAPLAKQIADHGEPGGGTEPHPQILPRRQSADRLDHRKPSAHRPFGVVLMRLGIAEIYQYPIAHVLGDKAVEAGHGRGDRVVIGTD
jgi:hypothetical protein